MPKSETTIARIKSMKPSIRFDMPATMDMPKVDDLVDCHVSGKVIRVESGKDRYGDGKKHEMVEIEHDKDAVRITKRSKRSLKQIEEADERV